MSSRRYSIDGDQNVAASPGATVLGLTGSATQTPSVYHLSLGCEDTPADNSLNWYVGRSTAAGTNTAVTPTQLSGKVMASNATAGENHTAEPTYTANAILFRLGLNQRASHSLFFGDEGALEVLASANNGLGAYVLHASATPLVSACMHFFD
jgi:hypothetical protein